MKRACYLKNKNTYEQNHAGSIRPLKNQFVRIKQFLFLFSTLCLAFVLSFGQSDTYSDAQLKAYFEKNKDLSGDVTIKNVYLTYSNGNVTKTFIIESPGDGHYFLSAWVSSVMLAGQGNIMKYKLVVNDKLLTDSFIPKKTDWHCLSYVGPEGKKATVYLQKGENLISFVCEAPETPRVEVVRLSSDADKSIISSKKYDDYRAQTDTCVYDSLQLSTSNSILLLKSAPLQDYQCLENVTVNYTYYNTYYFTQGTQVNVTTVTPGIPHVIELFSTTDPVNYSWSHYDYGYNSLSVNIPSTGYYYIKLRNFYPGYYLSWANITVNGTVTNNVPLGGNYLSLTPNYNSTVYNFFNCNQPVGNAWICLEAAGTSPGKIVAYNNDYYSGGFQGYDWLNLGRIKGAFPLGIRAVHVSSFGSAYPVTTCDLYGYVKFWPPDHEMFPDLEADCSMLSAPMSYNYNCISYSGGRTDLGTFFWPPNRRDEYNLNDWYNADPLTAFDNFYGNTPVARYAGAPAYTRTGATMDNGIIALYADWRGNYTHAAVKKPGNNQSHGFDWESKLGSNVRIFHGRFALWNINNNGYGYISKYYTSVAPKSAPAYTELTFEKSIELGLTKVDDTKLSMEETKKIEQLTNNLLEAQKSDFDNKFSELVKRANSPELSFQSNPLYLCESKEYKDILEFCANQGTAIWPLLYEKINNDNNNYLALAQLILNDVSVDKYGYLMLEVKMENAKNRYTKDGTFIAPSINANYKKYIKKLLQGTDEKGNIQLETLEIATEPSSDFLQTLSVAPNPATTHVNVSFNLSGEATLSIEMYDMNGNRIDIIKSNESILAGTHLVNIDVSDYNKGVYICKLVINKQNIFRKILVE